MVIKHLAERATQSENTHQEVKKSLAAKKVLYHRFNPELTTSISLDAVDKDSITLLLKQTDRYIDKVNNEIELASYKLIAAMFFVEKSGNKIHVKSRHDIFNKYKFVWNSNNVQPCLSFTNGAKAVTLSLIIKPDNFIPIYNGNEITYIGNVISLTWCYQSVELYNLYE